MSEIQPAPLAIIENNNVDGQGQEGSETSQALQEFFNALQHGENLGTSLENFLQSLPTGERVTLSITLNGAGRFEISLGAGDNLDTVLNEINTQFRRTADSVADETAGTNVQVNTSSAESAIADAFRNGTAQDLRGLQLTISGSAMGQSQSRTYEVSAYSFHMDDGSRITFSVINPDGAIEASSGNVPDIIISSSLSEEDGEQGSETTVLNGITIERNEDFTYDGKTYRFTDIEPQSGDSIIFRISDRGALLPLTADETAIFDEIASTDPNTGNMVLEISPESSQPAAEAESEGSEITRLVEQGTNVLQLGERFDVSGIAATFSVQRSGNSYNLVLHRHDGTESTIASLAGGRIFPNRVLRPSLSDAEEAALSTLISDNTISVQGGLGNETVRIIGR